MNNKYNIDNYVKFKYDNDVYIGRICEVIPYKQFIFFGDIKYKYKIRQYTDTTVNDVYIYDYDISHTISSNIARKQLNVINKYHNTLNIGDNIRFYSKQISDYATGKITDIEDNEYYICSGRAYRINNQADIFTLGLTTSTYINTTFIQERVHKNLIHKQ